ncbi:TIGR04282 family arsenosugar biosynthesis glycosyltransferase [Nitrosomonas ureae]|uniref:DUF2064 domain-containing protein n=1 Tax=Nitrosomonas ureae TaxID=44577 RepID=A0A1H2E0K1_9PROT|nr:DUF2064 domain-containing protein [Nitrosomonas ureae]ALQ52361.1 hypothetical protein ATY38_14775 [Nitrosomonas ureae]SDT88680.1 hypothetical protein SAMN05216406_10813 [Nitrosomonas ureae]
MSKVILVLLCKRPAPGVGKQRLAASLGVEAARQVADALLACALEDACAWPGPVVIAPADQGDVEWVQALLLPTHFPVTVMPQVMGNLGQRLNALDRALRVQGGEQLIFIGSDAPGLTTLDYEAACAALQHHDIVLIPALDGGVVLMANRCAWPNLSVLPWSSDRLGISLIDNCRNAGKSVTTIKQGQDVDELKDLIKLSSLLRQDKRPARRMLLELVDTIVSFPEIPYG